MSRRRQVQDDPQIISAVREALVGDKYCRCFADELAARFMVSHGILDLVAAYVRGQLSVSSCPCYGCKHHCSAHDPRDIEET